MHKTTELTVTELRDWYPERFEKEYHDWLTYQPYEGWSEYLEGDFRERHAPQGVDARSIWFSLHRQGAGAAFTGVVYVAKFMQHMKLDETYLPLYLAVCDDGSYVKVHNSRMNNVQLAFDGAAWDTAPSGVFSELSQDAWCELINEQWDASKIEVLIEDFCNDICHTLYKELEAEYDALTSEEEFIASCEANEITFEIDTGEEE